MAELAADLLRSKYEVGELLGEGFSGFVYACSRCQQGEALAAKVCADRPGAVKETRDEAMLLRSMCHSSIVKVHDFFDNGTSVYFVMDRMHQDLLDGLQSYVMREKVDMNGLVHVVRQMVGAVQYLHTRGIVHRDVKPENFLIDCEQLTDPSCRVVLADLGSACKVTDKNQRLSEQVGTTAYWSPEMYDKDYGLKVDTWALGICLHCMASNTFPFVDEHEVRSKTFRLRRVSRSCNRLVQAMLNKVEARRPSLDEVQHHPWLTGKDDPEDHEQDECGWNPTGWLNVLAKPYEQWPVPRKPGRRAWPRAALPLICAFFLTGLVFKPQSPSWDAPAAQWTPVGGVAGIPQPSFRKASELLHLLRLEVPLAPQGDGASKSAKRNERRKQRKNSGEEDAGASSDSSGWAIVCGGEAEFAFSPAFRASRQVSGGSQASYVPDLELPPAVPEAEKPKLPTPPLPQPLNLVNPLLLEEEVEKEVANFAGFCLGSLHKRAKGHQLITMAMDRKRMSIGNITAPVVGTRSSGTTERETGIAEVFERAREEKTRAVYVTSITDRDLQGRQSFAEKDRIVLVPPGSDEQEMEDWVKATVGYGCRKGLKPESPNQDSFSLVVVENDFAMYGVYDGHGPAGHDCSDLSLRKLCSAFLNDPDREKDPAAVLTKVFLETQEALMKQGQFDTSGTTCTIVYHDRKLDKLTIAHVGDSRSVLGKKKDDSSPWESLELTTDHKPDLPKEKARIESATPPGRVVFDGYYNHRVFAQNGMYPGLNMSRALGDIIAHKEAGLTAEPDVCVIDLKAEREKYSKLVLLVCTDGVWEFILNKEAIGMVQKFPDCQQAVDRLMKESWDRWMKDSDNEITDDITAMLVCGSCLRGKIGRWNTEWNSALAVLASSGHNLTAAQHELGTCSDGHQIQAMRPWLLAATLAVACADWKCPVQEQNRCVINASGPAVSGPLVFDGNVLVTHQATVRSDASFSIEASGNITVEMGSTLQAKGDLLLNATAIHIVGSSASAAGSLSILSRATYQQGGVIGNKSLQATLRSRDENGDPGILVVDAALQGGNIQVNCNQSKICLQGANNLSVTDPTQSLQMSGKAVSVDCSNSTLSAGRITIVAEKDLALDAAIPGFKKSDGKGGEKPTQLDVTTQGHMLIGSQSLTWTLERLRASAGTMVIASSSRIQTVGYSTCKHTADSAGARDRCFPAWPTWPGSWPDSVDDPYVSFDLVLLARTSLNLSSHAMLSGASSILCVAAGGLHFEEHNIVDVSGRGCAAGLGRAPGNTVRSSSAGGGGAYLAGGGTHLGRGGCGGTFDTHNVLPDASTVGGPAYDLYNQRFLPTEGASGGASGHLGPNTKETSSVNALPGNAAGGGLIWLSASSSSGSVTFGNWVVLRAEGYPGGVVSKHVAAGGAGGQILIFATKIATADEAPVVSVAGGAGACSASANVLSGGGGGGFVGFNWTATSPFPSHGELVVDVGGGLMGNDGSGTNCSWVVPNGHGLRETYGHAGQAMPLRGCSAGYAGLFCDPCDAGFWSSGGLSACQACENKPPNGNYTKSKWPNSNCPYSCGVGVPNRKSNPACLDPMAYALSFFGGPKGVLAILLAIVTSAAMLLWRRRKSGGLSRPLLGFDGPPGSFSHSGVHSRREDGQSGSFSSSWASCFWRYCSRRRSLSDGEPAQTRVVQVRHASEFQMSQEQLPFHTGRIYLQGENTGKSPWFLKLQVPAALDDMVMKEKWEQLARLVNNAANIPKFQSRTERALEYLYPPAAPLFAKLCRCKRARTILPLVREFCEAERLWRPIRQAGGELHLRFGCNRKATLAYLDVFDFARSPMDFAPVNLRKEAWLIPVQGQGTFDEPYEVDMSDPLLQRLEHTDHGPTAILSVLSTFNRIARRLFKDELHNLQKSDGEDPLQQLHEKVEQCASQCGLGGFVQVLAIWQRDKFRGVDTLSRMEDSVAASVVRSSDPQGTNSFMDLPVGPEVTHGERPSPRTRRELRLCLVFTEFSLLASASGSDLVSLASPAAAQPTSKVLTTPIAPEVLNEALRSSALAVGEESSNPLVPDSAGGWGLKRPLLRWGYSGSEQTAARTLVSLICFLAFDLLAFCLICGILFKTSMVAGMVWVLLPPLAQPFAFVVGILFLLTEDPDLGRLFANLEILGIWNAAVSLVVLIWLLLLDSLVFDILAMGIVSCVKGTLFATAAAQVSQLEADRDLSSMDNPQNEFVERLFSIRDEEEGPRRSRAEEVRGSSATALSFNFSTLDELSATRASDSRPSSQSIRSLHSPRSFSKPQQVQMPSPF
ncbi:pim2 [Symbiodinium necroappetens]|uniref:Pim2 protein n=1 Tax=Symbiodinium necroappetens TaxID=1628268 RepID=A0A812N793_9DINO|nr:pim2 [Symbiodinium necroappetens]